MNVINISKPKANKIHECDLCCEVIHKSEIYDNQTIVNGGDIYNWKSHLDCIEIAKELRMFDECDEGLTQDDFHEMIEDRFHNIKTESEASLSKFSEYLAFVIKVDLKNK